MFVQCDTSELEIGTAAANAAGFDAECWNLAYFMYYTTGFPFVYP